jgi:diphthamide biosynthesis protein 2
MAHLFCLEKLAKIIRENDFHVVTLQIPDEYLSYSVDIYQSLSSLIENASVQLFIIADSTYGSSVDDISALHVKADILIYFGTDLSSCGKIPVAIACMILSFDIEPFIKDVTNAVHEEILSIISTNSKDDNLLNIYLLCELCYHHLLYEIHELLSSSLNALNIMGAINIHSSKLPSYANLDNWSPSSNDETLVTNRMIVSGLIIDDDRSNVDNESSIVIYIGNKEQQIDSIVLDLSRSCLLIYDPNTNHIEKKYGYKTKRFQERSGGMCQVETANVIGIIIGSMGLSETIMKAILNRLHLLIEAANKKHYTFVMGRLNEAKIANFPEVDLYCFIANDDTALIPPKYAVYHANLTLCCHDDYNLTA